jgi:hypothetical protein
MWASLSLASQSLLDFAFINVGGSWKQKMCSCVRTTPLTALCSALPTP